MTTVVEIERRMQAPPEIVFEYFTDAAKHAQWQGVIAELDARPGGRYVVYFSKTGCVRGEYVVVDPPRRLVLKWGLEGDVYAPPEVMGITPGSSTVEIDFIADGEDTILRLRHSDLPEDNTFFLTGWNFFLPRLEIVVAGGDAGPDPIGQMLAAGAPNPFLSD